MLDLYNIDLRARQGKGIRFPWQMGKNPAEMSMVFKIYKEKSLYWLR